MNPSDFEAIVQRLVDNPHDQEALAYAHNAGASDPKSYALVLERVGTATTDATLAIYWLCEAAGVYFGTLGDAHRAVRVLMTAVERDPSQHGAADRLAQIYRDKGDRSGLAALLEHRTKTLAPMLAHAPELAPAVAVMHQEIAELYSDPSMAQPKKAADHYRRVAELDPSNAPAIFTARELYKSLGQYEAMWALYAAEVAIEPDSARRLALHKDEATTRTLAGDLAGATAAFGRARELDPTDPGLQQEYASSIGERIASGAEVPPQERLAATEALVGLAEVYDGEHGLAYSSAALDLSPAHDRGMQLYVYYARILQREDDLAGRFHAYLTASPDGAMSDEAAEYLAVVYENAGQPADAYAIRSLRSAPAKAHRASSAHMRVALNVTPEIPPAPLSASDLEAEAESLREPTAEQPIAEPVAGHAPVLSIDRVRSLLKAAQQLVDAGNKPEACLKYREVLESDPSHPEALSWVEDYLRTKREYAALRDVLMSSVRGSASDRDAQETRKQRLREVAGLCEGNLRDVDGAVGALKQLLAIDRGDEAAKQALTRILEKAQRWDDLANLLEQDATSAGDIDTKIALEKKLANLQEHKRSDFGAAGEAWARIAQLTPDDDRAVSTAATLFERAGQFDQAAQVIGDSAATIEDPVARAALLERFASLREKAGNAAAAGQAFAEAAGIGQNIKLWESAERCFSSAEQWDRAGEAAGAQAELCGDRKAEAHHCARAADHLFKASLEALGLERLERATDLDPDEEPHSERLCVRYESLESWDRLAAHLTKRAARVVDATSRVRLRKRAATVNASRLADKDAARESWLRVLDDGDDHDALTALVDFAVDAAHASEATTLLRRLAAITTNQADKASVALREAALLADPIGDIDNAISRYESILSDLDAACRPALQAIAALEEARGHMPEAARTLERELAIVSLAGDRASIASRLARLYEATSDSALAIRALDVVRTADPDDFDALARLCELCEREGHWARAAELTAERVEVEGDEEEASKLTLSLASILADRLDRGDEALACMSELADRGDEQLRAAYVAVGDRLGWKGIVAAKLVEWWFAGANTPARSLALRSAFDRFAEVDRNEEAARVAVELIRVQADDDRLAQQLETIALAMADHESLFLAHEAQLRGLTGIDRALAFTRQAEVRAHAGLARDESLAHGEQALASVPLADAAALIDRLASIAETPQAAIDLYERQVSRCKQPGDRVLALARAAQVASIHGAADRALSFYELALGGLASEETLVALETSAREGDATTGGDALRRGLCTALASGGAGARDGGRTRGALLRRASTIAHADLGDVDQAFAWMADALIACVDPANLDALEALGAEIGEARRTEGALTHALGEVFDGPLVRQLLQRRAKIRRELLGDPSGAAVDLKKLHDLSPGDLAVMDELSALLTELGDHVGMIHLYEDHILRGKDVNTRAELARKVAKLWEERLQDARESADAWRRVLRMKPGDGEATAGLERAKTNMLRKPDPTPAAEVHENGDIPVAADDDPNFAEHTGGDIPVAADDDPSFTENQGDASPAPHDSTRPTAPPPALGDTSDSQSAHTPRVAAETSGAVADPADTASAGASGLDALFSKIAVHRQASVELVPTPFSSSSRQDTLLSTDERPVVDLADLTQALPTESDDDDDGEVIIVDDFADVMDVEIDDEIEV